MSYFDYAWSRAQIAGWPDDELSQGIRRQIAGDPPFYGIVMLAMARADTFNLAKLRAAFPGYFEEARDRYNAPFALLDSDPEPLRQRVMGDYYEPVSHDEFV